MPFTVDAGITHISDRFEVESIQFEGPICNVCFFGELQRQLLREEIHTGYHLKPFTVHNFGRTKPSICYFRRL